MYNRYVPQQDGSHRKNRVEEPPRPSPTPNHPPVPLQEAPCHPQTEHKVPQTDNIGGFLRQLLPKDFDTGDLIVILLLLLMAGDCQEDRNNAIMTIALYFLM